MKNRYSLLLVLFLVAIPSALYANLFILSPSAMSIFFIAALIPMILIEALVMRLLLRNYSFGEVLNVSIAGNLLMGFFGSIITYIIFAFISWVFGVSLFVYESGAFQSLGGRIIHYFVEGQVAFGMRLELMVLFMVSVFLKRFVCLKILKDGDRFSITKAVIIANIASFAFGAFLWVLFDYIK